MFHVPSFFRCSLILFFRHPLWKSRQPDVLREISFRCYRYENGKKESFSNAFSAADGKRSLSALSSVQPAFAFNDWEFPSKSPPLAPLEKENFRRCCRKWKTIFHVRQRCTRLGLSRERKKFFPESWQCVYF